MFHWLAWQEVVRVLDSIFVLINEGSSANTMCVFHSDTIEYLKKKFLVHNKEPLQTASFLAMIITFYSFTMEPGIGSACGC